MEEEQMEKQLTRGSGRGLSLLLLPEALLNGLGFYLHGCGGFDEAARKSRPNLIGRRSKQLERYEQKMKEERQKRIRERQKEFFSEVEVHRERLEDVFKMKRERWKGFNKYVREFHKRKERIHREKIDRIQREKINLLKINDVEGYLRMVQDAKSDRVKQLLKETEKYLQKLGTKLQEAKSIDVDESRTATTVEKNEISVENEDETDQAKHYLEIFRISVNWKPLLPLLLKSSMEEEQMEKQLTRGSGRGLSLLLLPEALLNGLGFYLHGCGGFDEGCAR
nr:chromatin structure-remodeling complex protein SYD-like [Coffea arabica]